MAHNSQQVYRTTGNARSKSVDLFGVQAGDVHGIPDPDFHKGMFAPLKATGLYFHAKENRDRRTLLSEYDTLQMRSCFQLGLRGGSYGALEGLLLVVQDVGRCMDVIEGAEEKMNYECAFFELCFCYCVCCRPFSHFSVINMGPHYATIAQIRISR